MAADSLLLCANFILFHPLLTQLPQFFFSISWSSSLLFSFFFLLFKEWFFSHLSFLCQVQTSLEEFPFIRTLPANNCIIHESLPLLPSLFFFSPFFSVLSFTCTPVFSHINITLGEYSKYKGSLYKALRDTFGASCINLATMLRLFQFKLVRSTFLYNWL